MATTTATMTVRERFRAVCDFQVPDRLPMVEWASWWDRTLARWVEEGLPQTLAWDRYALYDHFGLDAWYQDWVWPRLDTCPQPATHGAPLVTDLDGYRALRPHLFPAIDARTRDWARWAPRQAAGEAVLWSTLEGFFWFPRGLLGIEGHLYALSDQPDLIHAINEDLAAWQLRVIESYCAVAAPDFITFAEDLSYNHGPMLSRRHFDEYLLPYYRKVVPALRERGIRVIVDSDGDVTRCAPWFLDAGIEGILPLERQAGVDAGRLRAAHPRLLMLGHYDKMVMPLGADAMAAEFARLLPVARGGGFIPSVDHQTPPGVSLTQYREYLALYRRFARDAVA